MIGKTVGIPRVSGARSALAELRSGVGDAAVMVVPSILAYGAVWGGLARQAGLSLGEIVAMCLLVSAGTAQFVALPMLTAAAPAALIVLTTYIVNLRHYLMAASLAPYFAGLSRARLALLAHGISDEAYALAQARFARHPARPAYFVGCAAAVYAAWYLGAVGGALLGSRIPDPQALGLDFVFPAVFIAILVRSMNAWWQVAVAGVAAVVALTLAWSVGGTWHIAVAGLSASVLGIRLAPGPTPEGRGGER